MDNKDKKRVDQIIQDVEKKIPNVSKLVNNRVLKTKIEEVEKRYLTLGNQQTILILIQIIKQLKVKYIS